VSCQIETKQSEKKQMFKDKILIQVLLVEDDTVDGRLVKRILASRSQPVEFAVELAESLSAAIDCLENREYDIVLLDLRLPDSSGIETVQKVSKVNPRIPIVVLTGLDDEETGILAIKNGATDYIVKSQSLENLLVRTILYALEREKQKKLILVTKEQIERAAKEWRTTFDSITDMISIHDKNFKIIRVNKALAQAFKTEPKELIGKTCYEVFHNTKQPCPNCPHILSLKTKEPATLEVFEPTLGINLGISTSPILDGKGEVTSSVHIAKDITERKQAEETLKEANETLKEYNQLKDEFVSTVSHELRTPLSIIMGAIRLILNEIPGKIVEEQRDILATAMKNVQRLGRVVDSLLTISKIESGRLDLQKKAINICELIKDTVSDYESLAQENGIRLDYEVPQESVDICLDPDKTKEILINLISNSLKFTPKGGWVRVTCGEQNGEVCVSVQDSGVGITKEDIPKLFDKFTQFGRKAGPGKKGTGLGLAIVRKLVELHDGKIEVESEVNRGTTFTVSLPLVLQAVAEDLLEEADELAENVLTNN